MMLPNRLLAISLLVGALGQIALASEFSDGVQLFFAGRHQAASAKFGEIIERGTGDPLVYYYRGLASYRLGQLEAADRDFATGAQMELSQKSKGVGRALQRVQGRERLRLEAHRRITRVVTKAKPPVAPRPLSPLTSTDAKSTPTGAVGIPLFRLASEVPRRRAALPDPFADDDIPGKAGLTAVPSAATGQPSAEPVGSGVVSAEEAAEDLENLDDPFALELEPSAPRPPASPPAAPSPAKGSGGVFGAMFRALRNATVPKFDTSRLLPGGGGPPPATPAAFPQESFPDEDPFAEPGFEDADLDADADPFDFDE